MPTDMVPISGITTILPWAIKLSVTAEANCFRAILALQEPPRSGLDTGQSLRPQWLINQQTRIPCSRVLRTKHA